ncbi:phosphatase PAP2 family protein [Erythrobacter sp. W302b]|uniref:phosphatase PAP2 family protein n=1 Tax=Erythrobacter sp. W302b TaxID=3389874 RepID=UPI00396B3BC1
MTIRSSLPKESVEIMLRTVVLTLSALVVGAACLAVSGPLLGDVAVTTALQSAFGPSPQWAEWVTDMAKPPLVVATMSGGAGLAGLVAGWRGAVAIPLAFGLGWLLDKALRAVIFAPRPATELVEVASASSSSGLPSTFGLVYGSIFGAVLLATANGKIALATRAFAVALIIIGAAARVVLGGHWASQMLASILLGLAVAAAALAMTNLIGRRERANVH